MGETTEALLKKLVFGLVGTLATVTVKFLSNMNETLTALKIESAQIHQTVSAHDHQLSTIESYNSMLYDIRSSVKSNEMRINRLENEGGRNGK